MRAGTYIKQSSNYRAFIPAPLPPEPALEHDNELSVLLSKADRCLGRLDGVTSVLPNPDLFVGMYVRHEAVLSSQIEGTQSTLEDILEYEVEPGSGREALDAEEVVNYVRAMNYGLERLNDFPLSLRLIREIHGELMKGVRGETRNPGEFRTSQNWIGPAGSDISTATFVPPPVHEMKEALGDLEKFLHDESLPVLIQCALVHAQFETIHPFLDGNGRVGRLLITLLLCQREILQSPLLYLSLYLKANRSDYYAHLMAVRNEGRWEEWVKFFLRGVIAVSQSATDTARQILEMRSNHQQRIIHGFGSRSANALRLLDHLFARPLLTVKNAAATADITFKTANSLLEQLVRAEIIEETTARKRNRVYRYSPYLDLFSSDKMTMNTLAR